LLKALPKVDLHRHLEGSLRVRTLLEIAEAHAIALPARAIDDLRPLATVDCDNLDFHRFLKKFELLRRFFPTREAVERAAHEAVRDARDDNIRYLELRFNPVALARVRCFPLEEVTCWVCDAVERAQRDCDIRTNLIIQIGRDQDLQTASELGQIALAYRDRGIVGLDLAGDERRYPAAPFASIFREARREGLHVTVHAGEAGEPENIEEAIEWLEAERIGHGVRCVEDSRVTRLLQERRIPLEVCPTSNLQTGVVQHLERHPLPDLLALNLAVSVNTDNPSVSGTTLTNEYYVAVSSMGITLDQVRQTVLTAAEVSFQSPEERKQLVDQLREDLKSDEPNEPAIDRRTE
jgi:adenosine deaminase